MRRTKSRLRRLLASQGQAPHSGLKMSPIAASSLGLNLIKMRLGPLPQESFSVFSKGQVGLVIFLSLLLLLMPAMPPPPFVLLRLHHWVLVRGGERPHVASTAGDDATIAVACSSSSSSLGSGSEKDSLEAAGKDKGNKKLTAAPQGMDPEDFRRSFTGGIACAGPVTDPTVVEPACSAVQQYNVQQNAKLEFVRVLRGYIEVGLPSKFILILEAIDAGMKKKCRAEILQDASNNYDMVLQSFEVDSGSPET
ncbi:hypothetical protein RHGRI_025322 [Rhododendron griersonianum]|uniref:Cystatin domain-containing protein n=1 Tax=Rhododendron griersonianum TaxID=479676 RepID=A0AAV6IU24_9ERIC|nr:hypothetical protein RHGRI_025322 [Rhododendron griersonianum]KAG5530339.1 hypothetical protein RHGRI_025322 [Rhododendron griersonianum]KAG5530340.1 hypothetical protein RHGRI_025322 [Rhododendron griersonianum]